jgi:tetratricopeptide (TPR) repeat protein
MDKFEQESEAKLRQLEQEGGIIRNIQSEGRVLQSKVQEAAQKAEILLAELEAKVEARTQAVVEKMTGGKSLDADEKQILLTREAEVVKKEIDQRTPEDWFSLGVTRYSEDHFDEARKFLELALEKGLAGEKARLAWYYLGTSYRYLGKYDQALSSFTRCYVISRENRDVPNMVKALNGMSKMHALLGNYEEALKLNSQAMSYLSLPGTAEHYIVLHYNKGLIHKLRATSEDKAEYKKVLGKLQGHSFDHSMLGLLGRDAVEFDLHAHPELSEFFEFCNGLSGPTASEQPIDLKRLLKAVVKQKK